MVKKVITKRAQSKQKQNNSFYLNSISFKVATKSLYENLANLALDLLTN